MKGVRLSTLLAVAAVAAAGGALAALTGSFDRLERATVSERFEVRGSERPDDVAVVAIDDVTFAELQSTWPFPRSLHARAIDRLHDAGAREIVYDVQFTEPTAEREDLALYDAIERAGGAVLATNETDDRGRTNVLGGDENLAAVGARAGSATSPDEDGAHLHLPALLRRAGESRGGGRRAGRPQARPRARLRGR